MCYLAAMEKTVVCRIPVSTILDDEGFAAIVREYADEAKIAEMPAPKPDHEAYGAMERFGVLYSYGAFEADKLVGFIVVLVSCLPHYSSLMATIESFYVLPDSRKYGTGARLLACAEKLAHDSGCAAVMVTAPKGGRLAKAMGAMGYRASHDVFVKGCRWAVN